MHAYISIDNVQSNKHNTTHYNKTVHVLQRLTSKRLVKHTHISQ